MDERQRIVGKPARIQSIQRADMILEAIANAPGGAAKLTPIARATGLHKNTAFSILTTLAALGYVQMDIHSRAYRLGRRVFEFAKLGERTLDVLPAARPLMMRLVAETGESVSLAVPSGLDALVISTIEGSYAVRGARREGHHVPYHASAVGKAILAHLAVPDRDAIVEGLQLERCTSRTLTTRSQLERELDATSDRGFALSLGEEEMGANAVAAPIRSRICSVIGAVAVWGPASRLTRPRLAPIGRKLAALCANLID